MATITKQAKFTIEALYSEGFFFFLVFRKVSRKD